MARSADAPRHRGPGGSARPEPRAAAALERRRAPSAADAHGPGPRRSAGAAGGAAECGSAAASVAARVVGGPGAGPPRGSAPCGCLDDAPVDATQRPATIDRCRRDRASPHKPADPRGSERVVQRRARHRRRRALAGGGPGVARRARAGAPAREATRGGCAPPRWALARHAGDGLTLARPDAARAPARFRRDRNAPHRGLAARRRARPEHRRRLGRRAAPAGRAARARPRGTR